jgi:hypothetical protein
MKGQELFVLYVELDTTKLCLEILVLHAPMGHIAVLLDPHIASHVLPVIRAVFIQDTVQTQQHMIWFYAAMVAPLALLEMACFVEHVIVEHSSHPVVVWHAVLVERVPILKALAIRIVQRV